MTTRKVKTEDAPPYFEISDDVLMSPEILERIAALAKKKLISCNVVGNPAQTKRLLMLKLGTKKKEVFGALFLDSQHKVIADNILFTGTIDGASVYPREVLVAALEANAAAVVFYHNHPSGECEPSLADRQITRRLTDALTLVDIRVLDHIIVSQSDSYSFAEKGLI